MHEALVEFHYAGDGKVPVRYRVGASVPVRPEHVARLVERGKIVGDIPATTDTSDEVLGLLPPARGKARKR